MYHVLWTNTNINGKRTVPTITDRDTILVLYRTTRPIKIKIEDHNGEIVKIT